MKLALFQTDIFIGAPQWNIDKVSKWIEGLPNDTDIAILPESFDTGDANIIYEPTLDSMIKVSKSCNIIICYNKGKELLCILPSGKVETNHFCYKGFLISKDKGGDLVIFSVAEPKPINELWKSFAAQNKCYVAGVNRIGYKYQGGSSIINYKGESIVSSDLNLECCISAVINLSLANKMEQSIPDDFRSSV